MPILLPSTIYLADPHPLYRDGLKFRVKEWYPEAIIQEAKCASSLAELLQHELPDLLITELHLPPGDFLEVLQQFGKLSEKSVIVLSHYKDSKLVRSVCKLGVLGYVHKSSAADEVLKAIRKTLLKEVFLGNGVSLTDHLPMVKDAISPAFKDYFHLRFELTRREIEVLAQIKRGLNNREIADVLYISEQTVCVHRKNILRKVGVNNTQKLLHITYEHHLT